jgi:ligand-binding sensor domain-containing protein/signal transduction histidine kinase
VTKKPKSRATFFCIFFWPNFAAALFAQPQDIRFEHISVEDGLSNYALTKIVQDQQGFLWFGTEDGLNKYDGYEFTVYKSDPADSSSLPNRVVQALYADRAGNVWVGAGNDGLHRYNPDTDQFDRFKHDLHNPESLAGKFVTTILEDSRGDLWIGTSTGLYLYNRQLDILTIYRYDPHDTTSISGDYVTALCEDRKGDLWIGTNAGLNRYERNKRAFIYYRYNPNRPAGLSSDLINCIREDRSGVIWIGTYAGLNRYDRKSDTITRCRYDPNDPHTIVPNVVFDIYEDSKGMLWIGTYHVGLWRYDAATDRFFNYKHDPDNPYSLSEDRIHCIYEDRSSVMWIGTYRHGLNRYNRRQDVFTRYQTPRSAEVYAVRQARNGELWIGTESAGLLRYDRQGKLVAHYRYNPMNPASLSADLVLAIYEDSRGELWIGTGWGLNRYDAGRRRFVRYLHEPITPMSGESYQVKTVYEDTDSAIWIGTKGSGLCRLDREKKTFTYYGNDPKNPQSISSNAVWDITKDKNGDLWIGTFGGGLNRFDRKTGTFTRYQPDAIYSVYVDQNGYIWAGTFGGGLFRLDPNTGRTIHYTDRGGLPDNFVKAILPDANGNLWLSTDKGLSKFNPENGTFKNYTVKDGLISNQFLSGAYYKSPDGRLFFGGEGGVIAFYPDSIKDNPHLPPVVITSFKVFDKPLPRALFALEEIKLSYRQNFFSFEFVALDYTVPAKNQYAYKLEGFDPDWIHSGARRYASYTNVDPGEYVFLMKGANSDGVWNERGAAINILITPPFWKTWWFRILAFAAIGALVWSAYRYRVNQLLQIERLRTRLSADLHDEIAGNLSSIAMFGKIIQDEEVSSGGNPPARSQLLERIIALSQESVTSIREIIWAIDPKPETIHDLLLRVRDLAVDACRTQNMLLKFDAPDHQSLPPKNLSPEQRKHLWLLLKEAINNAVKHSGGTELAIYASCKTGQLNISIIDNGSGLNGANSATRFSGKGLGTMKARAEQLEGSFGMLSDESGTTVNVTIKI